METTLIRRLIFLNFALATRDIKHYIRSQYVLKTLFYLERKILVEC